MLGTLRRLLLDCAPSDLEAVVRIGDLVDAARALVGVEWLVRGEALRRMEVIEFSRALSRVSGSLLRASDGAPQRAFFEQALRHLDFGALSLGLFEEPGRVSEQCQCLAAFGTSGGLQSKSRFPSSNFAAPGVFGEGRGAVLVQALVYEGEPLGLLTVPLGHHHGSLYEQLRETFAISLRGCRLATRQG
jgi:hypothetical protein